ncbi:hypothetical protein CBER1_04120 [Cercospora berteroae]|uniref:Major facilitator superfamily (MFS) profile domain-containing protein n=1 Tax=Cercospora berteroae TaxID=357750 RepID=A0A2S6CGR9_9PEZI|nr:hypothetical protein CBER1_04120 [Cercospora berteroae]
MAATNLSTDRVNELEDVRKSRERSPARKPSQKDSRSRIGPELVNTNPEHQEIQWLYLEFDTELPQPADLSQSRGTINNGTSAPPDPPNLKDYESPFTWSPFRKRVMTWLSCIITLFTAFNAGAYTSGIDQMTTEWNVSRVAALLGITTFTAGFGVAPMFLAPFSEINGRRPVFVITGVLWVVFQIVCGVTPTFAGMLINRFFSGAMSSTFSTMVGGVVSDIYHAKDRNTAMTLFTAAAIAGSGLGPLVCGFIAQHTTWRWIFYLQIIIDSVLIGFVVFFFKETRGSVLLSRKAKKLNKYYDALERAGYYGLTFPSSTTTNSLRTTEKPTTPTAPTNQRPQRIRYQVLSDEERTSLLTMIQISLHRPFHMLFTEPVVFFFSLWISFSWAVLYLTFTAVPLIYRTTYAFTIQEIGAVFTALVTATILFTIISIYQETWLYPYLPTKHQRILATPEGRLYFACIESALLPIGCIWFCITGAYPQIHWVVPAIGLGIATMGIFSIYLAVFNYLADSYHRFSDQMFNTMTFQGAGGFLGGVGFLLTTVPWVLLLFGPQIRAKSRLASEILKKG